MGNDKLLLQNPSYYYVIALIVENNGKTTFTIKYKIPHFVKLRLAN